MHFSGSVNCPQFMANRFRKNICTGCQQKIDAHSGASELQISEALEYACKYSSTGGGGGYDSLQKALMKKFLLMKSGDVESNPGPYQNNSDDLLLDETPYP